MDTADRMPINGTRVAFAPAARVCAVTVMPPDRETGEDRAARPDTTPKLVALTVEGIEPVHFFPFGRPASNALEANFGPATITGRWALCVAAFGAIPFTAA